MRDGQEVAFNRRERRFLDSGGEYLLKVHLVNPYT